MAENYQVMAVDDDKDLLLLLEHMLQKEGCDVTLVESGQECLQMVGFSCPDLILLDVLMPEMDGFEVCRKLKEIPELQEVPVIFITGLADRENILKGFEVGGVDYIPKPLDYRLTMARIKAALQSGELLKDKSNLLKINDVLLTKIDNLLKEAFLDTKIDKIKNEITASIDMIFDRAEEIRSGVGETAVLLDAEQAKVQTELAQTFRENKTKAGELLDQLEMSLQFGDRIFQQINEILKTINRINSLMSGTAVDEAVEQSSSKSVLGDKTKQSEIDDLFASLTSS